MSRLVRCLVLLHSLTLALPAGWCCMALSPAAKETPAPPVKPSGCCGCRDEAPSQPVVPAEKAPLPREPGKCLCTDRQTITSSGPEDFNPDMALVGTVPPDDREPAHPGPADASRLSCPGLSRPLHILDCVWLC
jgi:hypothetical protein